MDEKGRCENDIRIKGCQMNKAGYRKINDRSMNSSTYHKKDGTNVRAKLKEKDRKQMLEDNGFDFPPLSDRYEGCQFFEDETFKKVGDEIVVMGHKGVKLSATEAMFDWIMYTYDPDDGSLSRTYRKGECHQCLHPDYDGLCECGGADGDEPSIVKDELGNLYVTPQLGDDHIAIRVVDVEDYGAAAEETD